MKIRKISELIYIIPGCHAPTRSLAAPLVQYAMEENVNLLESKEGENLLGNIKIMKKIK